jgi:hypothetical protein
VRPSETLPYERIVSYALFALVGTRVQ